MWTTEAHRYVLLGGKGGRYSALDISGDEDMIMLIDDDELAAAVTDRMLRAGVPVRE